MKKYVFFFTCLFPFSCVADVTHEQFLQYFFTHPKATEFLDNYTQSLLYLTRDENSVVLLEDYEPEFFASYKKGFFLKHSFGDNDINCTTNYTNMHYDCVISDAWLAWDFIPKNRPIVYRSEFESMINVNQISLDDFHDALFLAMGDGIVQINELGTFKFTSTGNVSFKADSSINYRLGEANPPIVDYCQVGEVPIQIPPLFSLNWEAVNGCALLDSNGFLIVPSDAMFCYDLNYYGFMVRTLNSGTSYQTRCAVAGTKIDGRELLLVDPLLPAGIRPTTPPSQLEIDYCGSLPLFSF